MKRILVALGVTVALVLAVVCSGMYGRWAAKRQLLSVWRSSGATVRERAEAVNRFFPPGTQAAAIYSVLGKGSSVGHVYGSLIDEPLDATTNELKRRMLDLWYMDYQFSDGRVGIALSPVVGTPVSEFPFVKATPRAWAHEGD
jgi:hypothetical protein